MAEQHEIAASRRVVSLHERTAERGVHAEHAEEIRRHLGCRVARGRAGAGNAHLVDFGVSGDAPVGVTLRTHDLVDAGRNRASGPDAHEARRIGEWERAQEHRIDHGIDRGVRADPERETEHCELDESWRAREPANGDACVLRDHLEKLAQAQALLAMRGGALQLPACLGERAEAARRLGSRLGGREPLADQLLGARVEMKPNLLVHLRLRRAGATEREPEEARRARRDARVHARPTMSAGSP